MKLPLHQVQQFSSIVLVTLLANSAARAQIPADYKGRPFDNVKAMSDFYYASRGKEAPPSKFVAAKVAWDARTPTGSGALRKGDWPSTSSIGLTAADADGMQLIHYRTQVGRWNTSAFEWKWAAPQEPGIDPGQYAAISFSVKVGGTTILPDLFFSLTEQQKPVSLKKYDPNLFNGAWHTVTVPLIDLKSSSGATAGEVRGLILETFNWDFPKCDYHVYIDHITFDKVAEPIANRFYKFQPALGQKIPGKMECAFYDEGGEGVAYHDTERVNTLSALLNQNPSHERPNSNPYLWSFRADEGVDTSFTKDFADYSHPNEFDPPVNQLYLGNTKVGEWTNYTVQVEKAGRYKITIVYGGDHKDLKLAVDNGVPIELTFPKKTGSPHIWNRQEVGTVDFAVAGTHLLTLTSANANMATMEFELVHQ